MVEFFDKIGNIFDKIFDTLMMIFQFSTSLFNFLTTFIYNLPLEFSIPLGSVLLIIIGTYIYKFVR